MGKITWTKEDINFIKKYGKDMTVNQIAIKLGRSSKAVGAKVHREGLTVLRVRERQGRKENLTKEQVEFIKNNVDTMCLGYIARELRTSIFNIEEAMKQHGIVITKKKST